MGESVLNPSISIRRLPNGGGIQARRTDGKPLTAEDRAEAKRLAGIPETAPVTFDSIIDDHTVAVLIESTILGGFIWFALRDSWQPDEPNRIPIFYASELPALRQKTVEQLRAIYITKLAFGAGRLKQ